VNNLKFSDKVAEAPLTDLSKVITIRQNKIWHGSTPRQVWVYECESGHFWPRKSYSKAEYFDGCPVCKELKAARND
jgi:hypothetical protein